MMLVLALAAFALQTPPLPDAPVETHSAVIETLAERQVVQRDENDGADVLVEGSCADAAALVARVRRATRANETAGELVLEHALELRDLPGPRARFRAILRVPAGGWYALEIAPDRTAPALVTLERFGVGEVFVVAGQSNSTNFGEELTPEYDDRASSYDGRIWRIARDPMPGVQDGSWGGSPWPRFAQLLVRALDVPVAIASCGYGGTSIRHWQKDHSFASGTNAPIVLYDGLVDRLTGVVRARAVLWHQGETDAAGAMKRAEYAALFRALQQSIAHDVDGAPRTWFVARASYLPGLPQAQMDEIRNAQAELWSSGAAVRGPDTDDLVGAMRHSKDHVHFSKQGLAAHADRWFDVVSTWLAAQRTAEHAGAPAPK